MQPFDAAAWAFQVLCGATLAWLVAAAAAAVLRRSSAAVRHRVWGLSVLAALAVPPVAAMLPDVRLGWLAGPAPGKPAPPSAAKTSLPGFAERPMAAATGPGDVGIPADTPEGIEFAMGGAPKESTAKGAVLPPAMVRVPDGADAGSQPSASPWSWLWLAWTVPAGWLLARTGLSLATARRLARRSATIEDAPCRDALRWLCERGGLRAPRLAACARIGSPLCVGWLRPSILLPTDWRGWTADERDAALVHELAHAARGDVAWQLAAAVARALFWFHPLAWLAAWRMRVEREAACDDWAIRAGQSAVPYARALLAFAERRGRAVAPAAAVAMTCGGRFELRVRAILSTDRARGGVGRWAGRLLGTSALLAVLVGGAVSPLPPPQASAAPDADRPSSTAGDEAQAAEAEARPPADNVAPAVEANALPTRPRRARAAMAPRPWPRVAGRVVDEQGTPVVGAIVDVRAMNKKTTATTAPDGRFAFELPDDRAGSLAVHVTAAGGTRQAYSYQGYLEGVPAELELTLRPARETAVQVVDTEGRPIAGARVAAAVWWSQTIAAAESDADGRALLSTPADADLHYVWAVKSGTGLDYFSYLRPDEQATNPYRLQAGHDEPLTLVLNGALTVTVQVTDEAGEPLAGTDVYPWYFRKPNKGDRLNVGEWVRQTDERGLVTFDFLPADNEYSVEIWAARDGYYRPESLIFDPRSAERELTMPLIRLVPLRGRATLPDGAPAAGAEVVLGAQGYRSDYHTAAAICDDEGRFEVDVHRNSYCVLLASLDRFASPLAARVVKDRPIDEVALQLQPATRIHGRITGGPERRPTVDTFLSLFTHPVDDAYERLPDAEKLPHPTEEGPYELPPHAIPAAARNLRTGADGEFEFFAAPGLHYLLFSPQKEPRRFQTLGQADLLIELEADEPETLNWSGRVVLASDPERGVPDVGVTAILPSLRRGRVYFVTDEGGMFRGERGPGGGAVMAHSADASLAGLVYLDERDTECAIALQPACAVRGRVVDAAGMPLADKRIDVDILLPGKGPYHLDKSVHTDQAGAFEVQGLAPGGEYEVALSVTRESDGLVTARHSLATISPAPGETVELGDVVFKAP